MTQSKRRARERRYLGNFSCAWCGQSLAVDICGSIYGPPCTKALIAARAKRVLKGYKPLKRAERKR